MASIRLEELQAARARAFKAVTLPDTQYFWRKVCRWACEYLNVSIFEAEAMPLRRLLRHYYEWQFEGLDEEAREKVRLKIIETPEEAASRANEEVSDEQEMDEFLAMVQEEARRAAEKKGYAVASTKAEADKVPVAPPRPEIPDLATLPPDVTVNFVDEIPDDGWDLFGRQSSK